MRTPRRRQRDVDTVLRQLGVDADEPAASSRSGTRSTGSSRSSARTLRNIAARRSADHPCFLVSAVTGEGIDELLQAIEQRLAATRITLDLSVDAADGAGVSWLHRNAEVLVEGAAATAAMTMTVRVDETKRDVVIQRFGAIPHPD